MVVSFLGSRVKGSEYCALACADCPQAAIAERISAALKSNDKRERRAAKVARDIIQLSGCEAPFDPLAEGTIFESSDMKENYRRRALLEGTTLHSQGTDLYPTDAHVNLHSSLQAAYEPTCRNLFIEAADEVLKVAQGIIDLQENWNAGQGL